MGRCCEPSGEPNHAAALWSSSHGIAYNTACFGSLFVVAAPQAQLGARVPVMGMLFGHEDAGRAAHACRCVTLNAGAGPLRSLPALSSVRAHPAGCMPPQLLPSWGHDVAVARWGRWPRRTCIAGGVKALLRNFECWSWAPTLTATA